MLGKSVENLLLKSREFLSHPGVRRYGSNTAWMFAEQILRMVAGFFVGVWVARYLGPEKFGLFSYALAFVAIFQGIAKLGLDGILVRDLVREPEKATVYLGTAFWLKLFGAVVTLLFIGLAIQFTGNDATTNLYILIIASGLIFQSFEVIDFYFQSKVLAKYVSICKMVQLALSSLIKIFLILIGADLIWFVMVSLIDMVTLAITLNIAYKYNKNPSFYKYFDVYVGKRLLKDSWPLILSSVAVMIQARVDQVILKEMFDEIELGYYSAALRIIEVFGFIPMILHTSLLPSIVNAKKDSEIKYFNRLSNYYRLMFILFIIVALPIFLFGKQIILFLYGQKYESAGILLSLMSIRLFLTNLGVARSSFITIEGLFHYSLLTSIIGAILNITFNYFLISQFKSIGAILAAYLSFLITTFVIDFFYQKTRYNTNIMFKSIFTFYKLKLEQ